MHELDMDRLEEIIRARRPLPSPVDRKRLRERAGLSQRDVGDLLNTNAATITRWENGEREPGIAVRAAYRKMLERFAEIDG